MGLGAGMTLVPAFCILITYFDRHLEMATGIASMGGSIGEYIMIDCRFTGLHC
jgi:hypothetical protein